MPMFDHRMLLLQQLIDISCSLGPQQQTDCSGPAAVCSCWNRQTNGWTLYGFIDPVLHIMCLQCFDAVGWAAGRAPGL